MTAVYLPRITTAVTPPQTDQLESDSSESDSSTYTAALSRSQAVRVFDTSCPPQLPESASLGKLCVTGTPQEGELKSIVIHESHTLAASLPLHSHQLKVAASGMDTAQHSRPSRGWAHTRGAAQRTTQLCSDEDEEAATVRLSSPHDEESADDWAGVSYKSHDGMAAEGEGRGVRRLPTDSVGGAPRLVLSFQTLLQHPALRLPQSMVEEFLLPAFIESSEDRAESPRKKGFSSRTASASSTPAGCAAGQRRPPPFWVAAFCHAPSIYLFLSQQQQQQQTSWPQWVPPQKVGLSIITALHSTALRLTARIMEATSHGALPLTPLSTSFPMLDCLRHLTVFADEEEQLLEQFFLSELRSMSGCQHYFRDMKPSHLRRYPTGFSAAILQRALRVEMQTAEQSIHQKRYQEDEEGDYGKLHSLAAAATTRASTIPTAANASRKRHRTTSDVAQSMSLLGTLRQTWSRYSRLQQAVVFPLPHGEGCRGEAPQQWRSYPSFMELVHYFALAWLHTLAPEVWDQLQQRCVAISAMPYGSGDTQEAADSQPWVLIPESIQPSSSCTTTTSSSLKESEWWWKVVLPAATRLGLWRWWWQQPSQFPFAAAVKHTIQPLMLRVVVEGLPCPPGQQPQELEECVASSLVRDVLFLLRWVPQITAGRGGLLQPKDLKSMWEACTTQLLRRAGQQNQGNVYASGLRFVAAVVLWLACGRWCEEEEGASSSSMAGDLLLTWKEHLWVFFAAHEPQQPQHHHTLQHHSVGGKEAARMYFSQLWTLLVRIRSLSTDSDGRSVAASLLSLFTARQSSAHHGTASCGRDSLRHDTMIGQLPADAEEAVHAIRKHELRHYRRFVLLIIAGLHRLSGEAPPSCEEVEAELLTSLHSVNSSGAPLHHATVNTSLLFEDDLWLGMYLDEPISSSFSSASDCLLSVKQCRQECSTLSSSQNSSISFG